MFKHLRGCLALLVMTVVLCNIVYPVILLGIGQAVFPTKANGSLVLDHEGKPIGSKLIAQPFTGDQYFFPRPSAASYNAAASGASNWGGNNYLLRDRVARMLGPIVKYRNGKLVGPDIETWFQQDKYEGNPGIVTQWANAHPGIAAKWVLADPLNAAYVTAWKESHPDDVAQWKKDNPNVPEPKPEELAVPFFTSFSKEHPGKFPGAVTPEGTIDKTLQPVADGTDIQSIFFDMWRQEQADADLEPVPADMVMASGSGLDPHITLENANYQLDRVAGAWAAQKNRNVADVRREIEKLLHRHSSAALGGLVGVKVVNVLEMNLLLKDSYESQTAAAK